MRTVLGLGLLAITALPAWSEGAVSIAVPNRPNVPIIINGVDATWAVVEGDYGLARGIRPQPTIYGGRCIDPEPYVGHYFPSNGATPGYGRLEIEAPSRKPRRAESYYRSWTTQSDPPVSEFEETDPAPNAAPPLPLNRSNRRN